MSPFSCDLLVIGGGSTGTAVAAAASRRGLRTLLVEQYHLCHAHGSSHGPSRIIRLAYGGAGYVTLARESYDLWRALERESGRRLLRTTGGLDLGRAGTPSLERVAYTMRECGVAFERLSLAELARRFPQLCPDPGTEGLYQPDAGVLDADACVRALTESAVAHGCEILERSRVHQLRPVHGGVAAQVWRGAGGLSGSDAGDVEVRAGAAVVAAGSWSGPLLAALGHPLPLTVTREQVGYFTASDAFSPDRFSVAIEHRATRPPMISMFPQLSPGGGVKLMLDRNGPEISADDLSGAVHGPALDDLVAYARDRLPGLGPLIRAETCRYTMTPDEDFVLDMLPGRIGVAAACSGHGFKFAPVLGEIMVDLVTNGTTARSIAPFAADRPALAAGSAWRHV
ncbi:N-methyl-L-tryptophan oxidase [Nonomuraea sp. NPDC003707]